MENIETNCLQDNVAVIHSQCFLDEKFMLIFTSVVEQTFAALARSYVNPYFILVAYTISSSPIGRPIFHRKVLFSS